MCKARIVVRKGDYLSEECPDFEIVTGESLSLEKDVDLLAGCPAYEEDGDAIFDVMKERYR